jgi:hypothetical protein
MSDFTGYNPPAKPLLKSVVVTNDSVAPASYPSSDNTFSNVNPQPAGFRTNLSTYKGGGFGASNLSGTVSPSIPQPFVQQTTWAPPIVRAAPPRGPLGQNGGY